MTEFVVAGPYKVPVYEGRSARVVGRAEADASFKAHRPSGRRAGATCLPCGPAAGPRRCAWAGPRRVSARNASPTTSCTSATRRLPTVAGDPWWSFSSKPLPAGAYPPATSTCLRTSSCSPPPSVNDRLLDIRKTGQERWRIRGV